jgi:TetR/AcrR family fatty acid metabolism transcriptional regulator
MSRKKMGQSRRPQILEGLLLAVAERGLYHCNMSDVARHAKVSRGILHYYFKNKDEMIAELVLHVKDQNLLAFQERIRQIQDPWEQIRASLWYPVEVYRETGPVLAKVWIEFWGLATHHKDVHDFILEIQSALRMHFRDILAKGQQQGAFPTDLDTDRTASVILAALEGMVLQWHTSPETFAFLPELQALERMLRRLLVA